MYQRMTDRAKKMIAKTTEALKITSSAPRLCTTLLDPEPPNVADRPDERVCTVILTQRSMATMEWRISIIVDSVAKCDGGRRGSRTPDPLGVNEML